MLPTQTRKQNGITLIALIITIIVMLILVGVTVNVALNGGLFETANKAVKQTQKEADREILQAAVIAALNEQLIIENANAILKNLPDGWDVTGADGGPYTCTSPKENVFIVYENGEITEPWVDNGNGTFTKGDTTVEIGKTYTNEEFEELLKEKYTGAYTGDWQLIGIQGDKLKLVSTRNVNSIDVILGYKDQNVYKTDKAGNQILKDEIVDLNGDEDLKFEKAVWSYIHAVDTLDEVAQKATGISSARSVNVGDIESLAGIQDSEKGTEYTYNYTNHKDQVFVNDKGETIKIDSSEKKVTLKDTFYTKTLSADKIGTLASGYYWLASPCVHRDTGVASFHVRFMNNGGINGHDLFTATGICSSFYGVGARAVVLVSGL